MSYYIEISQILPDDPGYDSNCHAPLFINPGDGKAHIILLAGSPVIIAGVGHSVHAVGQPDIDHAFMYIRDLAGILALDAAFFQIVMVGVLGHAFDVSPDAHILQAVTAHVQDAYKHLVAHGKALMGIPDPLPSIEDISGDGVPELLIGYIPEGGIYDGTEIRKDVRASEILALYTAVDGSPSLVSAGWGHYYLGGGRFFHDDLDSRFALERSFGTYSITPDGQDLICEDYYFSVSMEEKDWEPGYFHSNTDLSETDSAEELDISGEEFEEIEDDLLNQAEGVMMIPFSDYAADMGYAYDSGPAVQARWLEDVLPGIADYETFTVDDGEYATEILFSTIRPLTDFEVVSLSMVDVYEDGRAVYDASPLYRGSLMPECPLAVKMTIPDYVACGISYTDTAGDGKKHQLVVGISGMDGSLFLSEEEWDY